MSYKKLYYPMKCVSRVASLHQAPSSLRLNVRQPRQGCLPRCSKKYTVATYCFKETHWQQGLSGEYEQTVECEMKDLERLRRLEDDLPVKMKYRTKGRPSKVFLQVSLGFLLDQVEGSPASEAWLAFTATGQEQWVCWQSADQQDGTGDDASVNDRSLGDSDPPLEYDDLWGSRDEEETLVEEEVLYPVTPVPCVTGYCEEGDGEWVTFLKPSTGKTLRFPRHTEEEVEERWRAP